jgi:putative membrane protein
MENILIRKSLTRAEIARIARVDLVFGLSALSTLAAGSLLWFRYGKGVHFYLKNPVFHTKLGLFLAVGLLSILPTLFFLKQGKGDPGETVAVPPMVGNMIRLELVLALLIPLLAVMMARGIGLG